MTTIRTRRKRDGTFVEVIAGGPMGPPVDRTDWARLDAMTDAEIAAAALDDPDNPPLTDDDLRRMKPAPRAKVIRRALNLTQEAFAARYHIPLGTLRDWEQGRAEPDQPTRAYLRAIAGDPQGVQ